MVNDDDYTVATVTTYSDGTVIVWRGTDLLHPSADQRERLFAVCALLTPHQYGSYMEANEEEVQWRQHRMLVREYDVIVGSG